jgi:hypothetical protein
LEPSKSLEYSSLLWGDFYKFNIMLLKNFIVNIKFTTEHVPYFWNVIEREDGKESEYVKNNLDAGLKAKIDKITEEKIKEEEEKKKFEKLKKREKEIYTAKNAGRLDRNGLKKKRKTLHEQEREAHEAYQVLLSEHNKKIRTRTMQKLAVINALTKTNAGQAK